MTLNLLFFTLEINIHKNIQEYAENTLTMIEDHIDKIIEKNRVKIVSLNNDIDSWRHDAALQIEYIQYKIDKAKKKIEASYNLKSKYFPVRLKEELDEGSDEEVDEEADSKCLEDESKCNESDLIDG